jgi:hypothetical protein
MTIGNNAPQIYLYPLILVHGDITDGMAGEGYKFTPFEVSKVVEKERSRIELMCGNFLYSGFNLWTP